MAPINESLSSLILEDFPEAKEAHHKILRTTEDHPYISRVPLPNEERLLDRFRDSQKMAWGTIPPGGKFYEGPLVLNTGIEVETLSYARKVAYLGAVEESRDPFQKLANNLYIRAGGMFDYKALLVILYADIQPIGMETEERMYVGPWLAMLAPLREGKLAFSRVGDKSMLPLSRAIPATNVEYATVANMLYEQGAIRLMGALSIAEADHILAMEKADRRGKFSLIKS